MSLKFSDLSFSRGDIAVDLKSMLRDRYNIRCRNMVKIYREEKSLGWMTYDGSGRPHGFCDYKYNYNIREDVPKEEFTNITYRNIHIDPNKCKCGKLIILRTHGHLDGMSFVNNITKEDNIYKIFAPDKSLDRLLCGLNNVVQSESNHFGYYIWANLGIYTRIEVVFGRMYKDEIKMNIVNHEVQIEYMKNSFHDYYECLNFKIDINYTALGMSNYLVKNCDISVNKKHFNTLQYSALYQQLKINQRVVTGKNRGRNQVTVISLAELDDRDVNFHYVIIGYLKKYSDMVKEHL